MHVAELDRVLEAWQFRRVLALVHFAMRVEHFEDALGGRDGLLKVRVDATELLRRPVHHEERRDEADKLAGRQPHRANLLASVPERDGEGDTTDEFHQRW